MIDWLTRSQIRFGDSGEFHEMALKPSLQRLVSMNRNGDADFGTRLCVDVMTAGYSLQRPAALLQQAGQAFSGYRPSHGDFNFLGMNIRNGRTDLNRKAALNSVMKVADQFLDGVALGGAARDAGNLGPVTAFFSLMDNCAYFHSYSLRRNETST